jgi:hypothetical protein
VAGQLITKHSEGEILPLFTPSFPHDGHSLGTVAKNSGNHEIPKRLFMIGSR